MPRLARQEEPAEEAGREGRKGSIIAAKYADGEWQHSQDNPPPPKYPNNEEIAKAVQQKVSKMHANKHGIIIAIWVALRLQPARPLHCHAVLCLSVQHWWPGVQPGFLLCTWHIYTLETLAFGSVLVKMLRQPCSVIFAFAACQLAQTVSVWQHALDLCLPGVQLLSRFPCLRLLPPLK